ncbi:hypothetical protein ACC716_04890 [Rhizobium johnstonii]|uniref:hypothetical protein n=1 Tax=Rhizobium johnstonii TaxID=3019933 RepID=UPI003F9AA74B
METLWCVLDLLKDLDQPQNDILVQAGHDEARPLGYLSGSPVEYCPGLVWLFAGAEARLLDHPVAPSLKAVSDSPIEASFNPHRNIAYLTGFCCHLMLRELPFDFARYTGAG